MFVSSFPDYNPRPRNENIPHTLHQMEKKYPILYRLFSTYFPFDKKELLYQNIVADYVDREGGYFMHLTSELENALAGFDILSSKKYEKVLKRLFTPDPYQSSAVFDELTIAEFLARRFGRSRVILYPRLTNGKSSDILLTFGKNNKKVFFEIGSLSERISETKIQQVLDKGCELLHKMLHPDRHLYINVRVNRFARDSRNHLDVNKSVKQLQDSISDPTLESFLSGRVDRLEINADSVIKSMNWERAVSRKARFEPSPGVTISAMSDYESVDYDNERAAFADQIGRKINEQVAEEKQVEPNERNIVVVKGHSVITSQYFRGGGLLGIDHVISIISDYLREVDEPNLTGVAFYDFYVDRAIYFSNNRARIDSKLGREDIEKIGFSWISSNRRREAKKSENNWREWKANHPEFRERAERSSFL